MATPELAFDLSVNLGNVLTMVGAIAVVVWKASRLESKWEQSESLRMAEDANRTREISEIKNAITEMKSVVTLVAVQKERLDNQQAMATEDRRSYNDRITRLEKMLDDLRHHKGFVNNKDVA